MSRARIAEEALVRLQAAIDSAKSAGVRAKMAGLSTIAESIDEAVGTLADDMSALIVSIQHLREKEGAS